MKKIAPICIMVLMLVVFAVHCARWCQEQSSPPTNTTSGEEEVTELANDVANAIEDDKKRYFRAAEYDLEIYEESKNYVRVFTDGELTTAQLMHIGRDLKLRGEGRVIYFQESGYYERGDEYACYQKGTLFDYRIKETEKAIIHL